MNGLLNSFVEAITRKIKGIFERITSNCHVHLKARKGNTGSITFPNTNMRLLKIMPEVRADRQTAATGVKRLWDKVQFLISKEGEQCVCLRSPTNYSDLVSAWTSTLKANTGRQSLHGSDETNRFLHFLQASFGWSIIEKSRTKGKRLLHPKASQVAPLEAPAVIYSHLAPSRGLPVPFSDCTNVQIEAPGPWCRVQSVIRLSRLLYLMYVPFNL